MNGVDIQTIDFECVFGRLRQLPVHMSVVWVKTISNGWCTSTRLHEEKSLKCIFGCHLARDETRHYLLCPVMRAIVCDSAPDHFSEIPAGNPCILASLGLIAQGRSAFYYTYLLYTLYHDRKNNIAEPMIYNNDDLTYHVHFSEASNRHYRRLASAYCTEMMAMLANCKRRRAVPGVRSLH